MPNPQRQPTPQPPPHQQPPSQQQAVSLSPDLQCVMAVNLARMKFDILSGLSASSSVANTMNANHLLLSNTFLEICYFQIEPPQSNLLAPNPGDKANIPHYVVLHYCHYRIQFLLRALGLDIEKPTSAVTCSAAQKLCPVTSPHANCPMATLPDISPYHFFQDLTTPTLEGSPKEKRDNPEVSESESDVQFTGTDN